MHSHLLLFPLAASLSLCAANPTTPPPHLVLPRNAVTDCQNITAGLDATCWDLLLGIGMDSYLNNWNRTTNTCQPGEMWSNCFMRLAGLGANFSKPIRCDLIGSDVCPTPTEEVLGNSTVEVGYGIASIWGTQQYMTSLYQALSEEQGLAIVKDGFFNQTVPRIVLPILKDILDVITDPIAGNLTALLTPKTPQVIGQGSWIIPTEQLAPQIVGQTVGYLLQWMMKDWTAGGFLALNKGGNLIDLLVDDGW